MINATYDERNSSSKVQSLQIVAASASEVQRDHGDQPLTKGEYARIWRNERLDGVELFQGFYRSFAFSKHFHRVPAIGIVDRGSMRSYCRRGDHVLGTGTVLLFNPGEIHAPAPAGERGWSFRMFYLEESLFRSASLNFAPQDLRFRQPFVQDSVLASSLSHLHQELESDGDPLHVESLLLGVFSRLADRHSEVVGHLPANKLDTARIDLALQYLEAHYRQKISLAELAQVSDLSPSHFLRMFRATTGLTPHAYLTQFRIEMAISFLRSGSSLADVASATGFTDQSHFTRTLKRIMGVTPGQYRPPSRAGLRQSVLKRY